MGEVDLTTTQQALNALMPVLDGFIDLLRDTVVGVLGVIFALGGAVVGWFVKNDKMKKKND